MLLPTLRRSALTARPLTSTTARTPLRALSSTPTAFARKDTQHKDSLKPEPNEYSKSGSDDAAAAVENAAFDPKQTRPETEKASAEKESGGESPQTSPLDVSPANHDVSKTQTKNEGATGNPSGGQVTKDRGNQTSGGSGAPKSGSGKYGSGSAN